MAQCDLVDFYNEKFNSQPSQRLFCQLFSKKREGLSSIDWKREGGTNYLNLS